jgi:hypothetical protein
LLSVFSLDPASHASCSSYHDMQRFDNIWRQREYVAVITISTRGAQSLSSSQALLQPTLVALHGCPYSSKVFKSAIRHLELLSSCACTVPIGSISYFQASVYANGIGSTYLICWDVSPAPYFSIYGISDEQSTRLMRPALRLCHRPCVGAQSINMHAANKWCFRLPSRGRDYVVVSDEDKQHF